MMAGNLRPTGFFLAVLLVFGAAGALGAQGQASGGELFVGLRPMVTVEPDYAPGELDINVVPVTLEWHFRPFWPGLRLTGLVNLAIRQDGAGILHTGILASLPWYPLRSSRSRHPEGWFLGPKSGLSYQAANGIWTSGLHLESGWSFLFGDWALTVQAEAGISAFMMATTKTRYSPHFGISCIIGRWLF